MRRVFLILAPILCIGAAPASFADRLLAAHNSARQEVGSPSLRWDPALANAAAAWAKHLAKTGTFEHATKIDQGENLWTGTKAAYSPEEMVSGWIDEKQHFKPGRFPKVSKTNDVLDVGHYTQLIWARTTHFGCAVASNAEDDFLVCRYSPPGNWEGQDPLGGPALKKAPQPVSKKRRRGG